MGLVNEVLPLDRLLPRAWEITEKIMQKPRAVRRLTSAVLRRQWTRRLVQDLGSYVAMSCSACNSRRCPDDLRMANVRSDAGQAPGPAYPSRSRRGFIYTTWP